MEDLLETIDGYIEEAQKIQESLVNVPRGERQQPALNGFEYIRFAREAIDMAIERGIDTGTQRQRADSIAEQMLRGIYS